MESSIVIILLDVAKAQTKRISTTRKATKSLPTSKSMKIKILVVVNILKKEIILAQINKLIKDLLAAWNC
jgi:hypothetical protein